MTSEPSHFSQEGDLLYRLLSLGSEEKLDSFLRDALTLVAEKTGADKGYIELRGQGALESEVWNAAFGLSAAELGTVKSGISTVSSPRPSLPAKRSSRPRRYSIRSSMTAIASDSAISARYCARPSVKVHAWA